MSKYIALEDADFAWRPEDIKKVKAWWKHGVDLLEMAQRLKRNQDEVFVLLLDQARHKHIDGRPGGIFGTQEEEDKQESAY